jgi:hypothetical protein
MFGESAVHQAQSSHACMHWSCDKVEVDNSRPSQATILSQPNSYKAAPVLSSHHPPCSTTKHWYQDLTTSRHHSSPLHSSLHAHYRNKCFPCPSPPTETSAPMSLESATAPFNASDPTASFLSSSCLDFLLIELVPLATRITQQENLPLDGNTSFSANAAVTAPSVAASAAASTTASAAVTGTRRDGSLDDEEAAEAVQFRLESQGYRVGQGLVER